MCYNYGMKKIGNVFGKFFGFIMALIIIIVAFIVRVVFMIFAPTKIIGKENLKKVKGKGAIIAANHYSNIDIVFLVSRFYKWTFKRKLLGKKELGKGLILKWFFVSIGTILIDRGAVDREAFRKVNKALNKNQKVVMFPEGTRNKTGTDNMGEIKSGVIFFAKKADAYIVPLRFTKKIRFFHKNIVKIGEPYKVGEEGKLTTEEEVRKLELKYEELK